MPLWNHYFIPETAEEALDVLKNDSTAQIVAGGTDLLLELQQVSNPAEKTLVDVTRIPELHALETRNDALFIGAAVPLKQVADSDLVKTHAYALNEASNLIGGPQVRNVATLGGNVAHALPAADGTIALLALDALAEVFSKEGKKQVPMISLFKGPGESTLDPRGDLLVGFYIKLKKPHQASAFKRIMRPQGVALPVLNLGLWLDREDNKIRDIRISVGPAGKVPQRGTAAENELRGKSFTKEIIHQAELAILDQLTFRTSPHRATSDYRKHICGVLLEQVIKTAWERAEA